MNNDSDSLENAIKYYAQKTESAQAMLDSYKNSGVTDDAWEILRWIRIHSENKQLLSWLTELQSYRNRENVDEN